MCSNVVHSETTRTDWNNLGSGSTVTNQSGGVVSSQQFDPWGKVRSGGISVVDLNYTGQRKDDTGLLYYHARYYDPSLARFVSPDSIVPGASSGVGGAGGSVGSQQTSKLTVDFRESGFLSSVKEENRITLQNGFWFQLSATDKQRIGSAFGPSNPQSLNRYAYVLSNPLRYLDPTGHVLVTTVYDSPSSPLPSSVEITLSYRELGAFLNWVDQNPTVVGGLVSGLPGPAAVAIAAAVAGLSGILGGVAAAAIIAMMLSNAAEWDAFMAVARSAYAEGGTITLFYDEPLLHALKGLSLLEAITGGQYKPSRYAKAPKVAAQYVPDGEVVHTTRYKNGGSNAH